MSDSLSDNSAPSWTLLTDNESTWPQVDAPICMVWIPQAGRSYYAAGQVTRRIISERLNRAVGFRFGRRDVWITDDLDCPTWWCPFPPLPDNSGPLRFAYADPPYLGCCALYDHFHGDDGMCWNDVETHRQLIARLVGEYPDGWALSATSGSLRDLLPLCPPDVRVAAWCKTFGAFKKGVRPAYMWEPVIFWRGRNPGAGHRHLPPPKGGKQNTPKDFHEAHADALLAPITLRKGFTGAKPESFCLWVLDLLNVQPGDTVDDLFPGTGVMGRVADLALACTIPSSDGADQ